MTRNTENSASDLPPGRVHDLAPGASRQPCPRCGGVTFLRIGFGAATPEALTAHISRDSDSVPPGEQWWWTAPCEICGDPAVYVCRQCSAEISADGLLLSTAAEGHCSCGPITQ